MSGIAGIVSWEGRSIAAERVQAMLELISHRGPDGLFSDVEGSVGLGTARLALSPAEKGYVEPVWLPDRACGAVADARLYNREDLLAELGTVTWHEGEPSDPVLILAGYERWGVGLLDRLNGDFAFAVWDRRQRRLFAARDPWGLKPLFYRDEPETFRFASEPKQLGVGSESNHLPDDLTVGQFLLNQPGWRRRTFVQGISRLEAGHYLFAEKGGVEQVRYWNPGQLDEMRGLRKEEYTEGFRELLGRAVARRLTVACPVGVQLSGGLDSSAIVITAAELARQSTANFPAIVTVSEAYPGLSCDESVYVEAVAKEVSFQAELIDCSDIGATGDLGSLQRIEDAPEADMAAERSRRVSEVLSSFGAPILLTGLGGDEVTWEPDWTPDLLRTARLGSFLKHCRLLSSQDSDLTLSGSVTRAIRSVLPESAKRAVRGLRRPRIGEVPPWIKPEIAALVARNRIEERPTTAGFGSFGQEQIYSWLTSSTFLWGLERAEIRFAHFGKELRHPFLDRELVEFVLRIPWQQRLSPPGTLKPLLRRAMGHRLPIEVRDRNRRAVFDSFFRQLIVCWVPTLMEVVESTETWRSERYTDREKLLTALSSLQLTEGATARETMQVWAAVNVELWLRQLEHSRAAAFEQSRW